MLILCRTTSVYRQSRKALSRRELEHCIYKSLFSERQLSLGDPESTDSKGTCVQFFLQQVKLSTDNDTSPIEV